MTVVEEYSAEIIKHILSMTFTGSIISFLLFLLKPIIKDKLPKSFQYYMWFSAVIALMIPVSTVVMIPVSNNSAMSMTSTYDIAQWISDTASKKPVNLAFKPQNENEQCLSIAVVLFVLWQLGMILVLVFHIVCYALYARSLNKHNICANRKEIELLNNLLKRKNTLLLYKNPTVEIPILTGLFRPAVILPNKKYEDLRLRNILMHEITHMKRYDILVKRLLILVGAIHWFNPLVYFVRREINKACELACDESVIKKFNNIEMQQYGDTLITVAADSIKKMPLLTTMLEDKKNLKERLDAIMKQKQHSKRTVIAASVFLVIIVCAILGLNTLHRIESEQHYADNYPLPQDQKHIKEIELKNVLRNYDKKNIAEAYIFLSDLDDEITNAYITIICHEKNPSSEMQNEIKSLASENLELDIQNIYVDYIDFESFTSNERVSNEFFDYAK